MNWQQIIAQIKGALDQARAFLDKGKTIVDAVAGGILASLIPGLAQVVTIVDNVVNLVDKVDDLVDQLAAQLGGQAPPSPAPGVTPIVPPPPTSSGAGFQVPGILKPTS